MILEEARRQALHEDIVRKSGDGSETGTVTDARLAKLQSLMWNQSIKDYVEWSDELEARAQEILEEANGE